MSWNLNKAREINFMWVLTLFVDTIYW